MLPAPPPARRTDGRRRQQFGNCLNRLNDSLSVIQGSQMQELEC
jgi:hypothetical protein